MADTDGIKTLRQVVDGLLLKTDTLRDNFFRWAQYAMDCYRELRLFHLQEYVWAKLTPDALNQVAFPDDCVQFKAVYVPVGGRLVALTREDEIVPTTSSGTLDSTDGEGVDLETDYANTYYQRGGVNTDGYFTVDEENRVVILNAVDRTEVIMCYVSSGVSSTDSYVKVKIIPAIESYILWKDRYYVGKGLDNVEYYKRQYEEEKEKINALTAPTLTELRDTLLKHTYRTPKR